MVALSKDRRLYLMAKENLESPRSEKIKTKKEVVERILSIIKEADIEPSVYIWIDVYDATNEDETEILDSGIVFRNESSCICLSCESDSVNVRLSCQDEDGKFMMFLAEVTPDIFADAFDWLENGGEFPDYDA